MTPKRIYFRALQGLLALLGFGTAFSCFTPEPKCLYGPPIEDYRDSTEQEQASEVKPLFDIEETEEEISEDE